MHEQELSTVDLTHYGWSERVAALAADHPHTIPGRVARVDRGAATVLTDAGPVRLATHGDVVTGDWTVLTPTRDAIVAVLPRWSALARHSAARSQPQMLAANVDVVLLTISSARPRNDRRLERLLAVAWESGARPLVVLTKTDVSEDLDGLRAATERVAVGVDVLATSAATGVGLDALRAELRPTETAVLVGESGAGKSTLVNALVGAERMGTGAVRRGDGKGRHTTTTRELIPLEGGAVLLDSPGVRTVGLWGTDEGLDRTFADVIDLATGCRFRDCGHDGEPGCAVAAAIHDGELDEDRLAAYRKLLRELAHARRQADVRERREAARKGGRMGRDTLRAKEDRRRGRH